MIEIICFKHILLSKLEHPNMFIFLYNLMHLSLLNIQILEDFASWSKAHYSCTQRRSGARHLLLLSGNSRAKGFSANHFHFKESPLCQWVCSHWANTETNPGVQERRSKQPSLRRAGRERWMFLELPVCPLWLQKEPRKTCSDVDA